MTAIACSRQTIHKKPPSQAPNPATGGATAIGRVESSGRPSYRGPAGGVNHFSGNDKNGDKAIKNKYLRYMDPPPVYRADKSCPVRRPGGGRAEFSTPQLPMHRRVAGEWRQVIHMKFNHVDSMNESCKPVTDVGLGVVISTSGPAVKILVSRRPETTVYGGYWEFPGGKVDPGETPADAVVRELFEELAITVRVDAPLPTIEHVYEHAHVRLHPFVCTLVSGEPENREVAAHRWVTLNELPTLRFPEANAALVEHLARRLI